MARSTGALLARGSRGFAALVLAAAGALLLAGCSTSAFHYVKSDDYHTYFKVPNRWKLFDENTLLDPKVSGLSHDEVAQTKATTWLLAFDANPRPALHDLLQPKGYPSGLATVQQISPQTADTVSLQTLRNLFFDIDGTSSDSSGSSGSTGTSGSSGGTSSAGAAATGQQADVLTYEAVNLDGGFHGSHLIAKLDVNGRSVTVNQIAVLDQATTKIYAIVVTCTTTCYERNQSKIEQVVNSWTVRDS
jgi:hypothetical protein